MIKKYIIVFIIVLLNINCTNKNNETKKEDLEIIDTNILTDYIINNTFYIIPSNGLNLLSEPNNTGQSLFFLPQNTELTVIERNEKKEIIDGIYDYWYKVEIENKIGWVFGGYLANHPIVINNNGKQIPKFIYDLEINLFPNGTIFYVEDAIEYYNKDVLTIYENNNKESSCYVTDFKTIYLYNITETPDWFFAITSNAEALGYIYIYDISEKSYYGEIINKENDNLDAKSINIEYELIKKYQNIKRYGPLLLINHNNNKIEFMNTFNGISGGLYQLVNYYPDHNEILAIEQYYEGSNTFIYNLNKQNTECNHLAYHHLYFNETRTALFSLNWGYGGPTFPFVKIYNIDNGLYNLVFDDTIFGLYSSEIINSITWVTDYIIKIDCTTGIAQITISGETVELINNLDFNY